MFEIICADFLRLLFIFLQVSNIVIIRTHPHNNNFFIYCIFLLSFIFFEILLCNPLDILLKFFIVTFLYLFHNYSGC